MAVTKLPRIFMYNEMTLTDPDASMTVEAVKEFYAETYPELTQAEISGPETTVEGMKWEFDKTVGTKGAPGVIKVQDIAAATCAPEAFQGTPEEFQLSHGLTHIMFGANSAEGSSMMPPSAVLEMI